MKVEYEAFRTELLDAELSMYAQPRETLSISYLLKGKCGPWTQRFVERFPHLKQITGFYNGWEHFWCQDTDGSIVDPTIQQFGIDEGDPEKYKVFDEATDEIFLGKCMNCGLELYGLMSEGQQSVCKPEESDCEAELLRYYNSI